MTTTCKEYVFTALRLLLTPIVKILLRNGVSYKEFCALSKDIFVAVAAADFGVRGRATNVSRIALLTGLDRKEVKRLKDSLNDNKYPSDLQANQDRFTRLLSAWHLDEEFLDESGLPNILPLQGNTGSFSSLVKRYAGDVPIQALLKELVRAGAVKELSQTHLRVLQRNFFPAHTDPAAIVRAGSVLSELADTLFHNLYECHNNTNKIPRFERRASNKLVDTRYQKAFKAFLDKEGQVFLERIDGWLSAHEVAADTPHTQPPVCLGVGVYCINHLQNSHSQNNHSPNNYSPNNQEG